MQHIISTSLISILAAPYSTGSNAPRRKSLQLQQSTNAFVKPVKQDFVRNPRMMPMTRCMILMLMGWAGQEQSIETTIGIIAKKLGRSSRQVKRYLDDAIEEGYLYYSRTKDRLGYYTGIKVRLNFTALKPRKTVKKKPKTAETQDMTLMSDTNNKSIYKSKNTDQEQQFLDKVSAIAARNDIFLN